MEKLDDDAEFTANTSGLNTLTHALPILADMPIETLLRIRGEERESFEAYRIAITKMSGTALSEGMTEKQALQFLARELAPSLEKIKREMSLERKRQNNRTAVGLASIAAGVAIGAFAGLPLLASAPLAVLGTGVGGRLLIKAAESRCEHGADLRQKNDLFFLLRLIEEGQQRAS